MSKALDALGEDAVLALVKTGQAPKPAAPEKATAEMIKRAIAKAEGRSTVVDLPPAGSPARQILEAHRRVTEPDKSQFFECPTLTRFRSEAESADLSQADAATTGAEAILAALDKAQGKTKPSPPTNEGAKAILAAAEKAGMFK